MIRYARLVQPSVVSWYDANAARLAATYEAVPPTPAREWLADLLPAPPALVVDVGAGTGRDAGAFAAMGYAGLLCSSSGVRSCWLTPALSRPLSSPPFCS